MQVDLDIVKPGDVQHRVHVVSGWLEHNSALVAAMPECLYDSRGIVCRITSASFDCACLPGVRQCGGQAKEERSHQISAEHDERVVYGTEQNRIR